MEIQVGMKGEASILVEREIKSTRLNSSHVF